MKHYVAALGIVLLISTSLLLSLSAGVPLSLSGVSPVEESATLSVSADVGLSSYQRSESTSNGLGVTTAMRQNQNMSGFESHSLLMAFDAAPVKGWTIAKAYLHLYLAKGDLHGVGLTEVLAPWSEPRTVNFTTEVGGPSWLFARTPKDTALPAADDWWAWPGSSFCSVAWAHPSARYQFIGPQQIERARVGSPATQPAAAGRDRFLHLKLPVEPDLVAALAAGTCYGLVLTDDKGQVAEAYSLLGPGVPYKDNDAEDIYVFTRDVQDATLRPRLEVFGERKALAPPSAPRDVKVVRTDVGSGTLWLEFAAPAAATGGGLLAYDVSSRPAGKQEWTPLPRWALPRPAAAGGKQIMPVWTLPPGSHELAIRCVDKAGSRGDPVIVGVTVLPRPEMKLAAPIIEMPPPPPGKPETAGDFTLAAVPDLAKVDPVSGRVLRYGDAYRDDPNYLQGYGNAVFTGQGVTLTAAANEVAAFQLIVTRKAEKLAGLKVEVSDLTGPEGRTIAARPNAQCFRVWYVKTLSKLKEITDPEAGEDRTLRPVAWHGDACLPLAVPFDGAFDLPAADNAVPGQTNQAVWVDLFVPKTTPAGTYRGRVKVTAGGATASLPLAVKILPLVLPDEPTWRVELNSYGGLAGMAGVDGKDPKAVEAEYSFYRLAKAHRQMINALPYGQRGTVDAARTPVVGGEGAAVKVTDWSPWDTRLGPLLDGSAFTAEKGYVGPGTGTPISQLYLPFHENWPLPIARYFGDYADVGDRLEFAEWAKKSRPLEEAYGKDFKDGFAGVARQFAEHFKEKGWTRTEFQFLLNNKYYYRAMFFGTRGRQGTSFWLLDEPVDHDDYAAGAFFLSLARLGVESARTPEVRFVYRADISMPEMTRSLLNGVCDFWMLGWGTIPEGYVTTARVRQLFLPGERFWQYGGAVSTSGAPVGLVGSFLAGWCSGSDGILPYWNTMGGRDWSKADDLAIFYSGKNYAGGAESYPGALPGLRMKVMRRAQQDVEYLQLLSQARGWNRDAVRQVLAAYADDPVAPSFMFKNLTPERAVALRAAVAQTLIGANH